MEIEHATEQDAEAIRRCAEAAYAVYVERIGRAPAPMVADFAAAVRAGHVVVMREAGDVAGYVVFYPRGDHLHLENLAVHPRRQGRGVGGALVGFVEACAGARGAAAVELYTNAKMTENLALYPKLGYEEIDRRREDGFDRVYFRKGVPPTSVDPREPW